MGGKGHLGVVRYWWDEAGENVMVNGKGSEYYESESQTVLKEQRAELVPPEEESWNCSKVLQSF